VHSLTEHAAARSPMTLMQMRVFRLRARTLVPVPPFTSADPLAVTLG
jgi:hypothetical protein